MDDKKTPDVLRPEAIFLSLLKKNITIEEALAQSALKEEQLFRALKKSRVFVKQFSEIIDFKLEMLFLDAVFKNKTPALITFALQSRVEKYNKNKVSAGEERPSVPIVFVEHKGPEDEQT